MALSLYKVPGKSVKDIEPHIWYPDLHKPGVNAEVMDHPGFMSRFNSLEGQTDSIVEVFQLNKGITAPHGGKVIVPVGRPGIIARMPDAEYIVHLPVRKRALDMASFAVRHVELPHDETDPDQFGPDAGRIAGAMAIYKYINETNPSNNQ